MFFVFFPFLYQHTLKYEMGVSLTLVNPTKFTSGLWKGSYHQVWILSLSSFTDVM